MSMYDRMETFTEAQSKSQGTSLEPVELKDYTNTTSTNSKLSDSNTITSSLVDNDYAAMNHNDNNIAFKSNNRPRIQSIDDVQSRDDSNTSEGIIRLRNIHKTYLLGLEGVPALRGVSVSIERGEFIVILGKSGGGKTSMLNIIGTIDKPTKGDLYLCGKRISSATTDSEIADLRLREVGFCFQTFNLIGSMTAAENVELPMILHGTLSSSEIKKRAISLLTQVGLGKRAGHLPSQLSGGEQQRVTISRAIANNPDVLLLDEPTGDLDTKNSHIIMDLLLKLNREKNITCVFVTHDVGLKYFAHRVIHMLDGKISKIETVSQRRRDIAEKELRDAMELDRNPLLNQKGGDEEEFEIRDPKEFYPYLSYKRKYEAKQKMIAERRRLRRQQKRESRNSLLSSREDQNGSNGINGRMEEEDSENEEEEEEEESENEDMLDEVALEEDMKALNLIGNEQDMATEDINTESIELETAETQSQSRNVTSHQTDDMIGINTDDGEEKKDDQDVVDKVKSKDSNGGDE